jgi:hypothetical protein
MNYQQRMDKLIKEYEAEDCYFDDMQVNKSLLQMYTSRMEDCHLKCVLHKFLEGVVIK